MKDPYEVLGISRNATDEEVKNAYRNLARKYHPDSYANNPLSDLAEEKMQEINEAYDKIMNSRRHRGGKGNSASGSAYSSAVNSNFADVRSLICSGRIEEAQELLDGVPPEKRDAEWSLTVPFFIAEVGLAMPLPAFPLPAEWTPPTPNTGRPWEECSVAEAVLPATPTVPPEIWVEIVMPVAFVRPFGVQIVAVNVWAATLFVPVRRWLFEN